MARPSKPFSVVKSEGRSHRTKSELEARRKGEESLASGEKMKERKEVKNSEIAHKEFMRINKLLKKIDKNDALFEGVINRYCLLYAECKDFEEKRELYHQRSIELEEKEDEYLSSEEMSPREYYGLLNSFQAQVISLDKQVQAKRKMLFDIEKENIMTVAAGLRNIPKKEAAEADPLKELLRNG